VHRKDDFSQRSRAVSLESARSELLTAADDSWVNEESMFINLFYIMNSIPRYNSKVIL